MAIATQEAAKPKFKGHKTIVVKTDPLYPSGVERDYDRTVRAYMKLVNQVVRENMPEIVKAAKEEKQQRADGIRMDSLIDLRGVINEVFERMRTQLSGLLELFGLRQRLQAIGDREKKLSIREWKKVCQKVLGINILDDYYEGEFYRENLRRWVQNNVDLIVTIPHSTLNDMQDIVLDGFLTGKTGREIAEGIQRRYRISTAHATFIARDQVAKLNADITRHQQEDAGVEEYTWSTSGDNRVRATHRKLDGTRQRWDSPPIVSEPGKPVRRCHPGEDYQCRCVALPVFKNDTLNLPIKG